MTVTSDEGSPEARPPGGLAASVVRLVTAPVKASRSQRLGLAIVAVLTLGPIAAALAFLDAGRDPTTTVMPRPEGAGLPEDAVLLDATVMSVAPASGEVRLRIEPDPQAGLRSEGTLAGELTVFVSAVSGNEVNTFPAGSVPGPFEVSVPMGESNVSRYPFDNYRMAVLAGARVDGEPVPVRVHVESISVDFDVDAVGEVEVNDGNGAAGLVLDLDRRWTTVIYAVGVMGLMWLFAVAGVLASWTAVVWQVEPPAWVYGFFVGVLFALPPLRNNLPGEPPPGTIVDLVAFYWAVAVVAVTLLLLLLTWVQRTKAARSEVIAAGADPGEPPVEEPPSPTT